MVLLGQIYSIVITKDACCSQAQGFIYIDNRYIVGPCLNRSTILKVFAPCALLSSHLGVFFINSMAGFKGMGGAPVLVTPRKQCLVDILHTLAIHQLSA